MVDQLYSYISKTILSSTPCKKFLEFDGISTNNLVIKDQLGKLLLNCKNVTALKNNIKGLGVSFTIIKNLDEYHFLICNYIPKLNDQDVFKIKFQKIRLLFFLFLDKFVNVLLNSQGNYSSLNELNKIGNSLVLEISELNLQYRELTSSTANPSPSSRSAVGLVAVDASTGDSSNEDNKDRANLKINRKNKEKINLKKDYFVYFDLDEEQINRILFSIYGLEDIYSDIDDDDY